MRARIAAFLAVGMMATPLLGKDVYLPVAGSVGVFRTDVRIFNPSSEKEITVQAYYLPLGNGDNSAEQPVSVTIGKREQKIYDDVVASLLNRGGLGAIRLSSPDDFVVAQRVYATSTTACGTAATCTLGQGVQGLAVTEAKAKGVLLQLKGSPVNFRTNFGAVNPNASGAKVIWRLYDRTGALVAKSAEKSMPPFAALGLTSMTDANYFANAANADLTDAWISYEANQPIFVFGSIVDNASGDQTYVPAEIDSGTTPPEVPQVKTVTIVARDFTFTVTPSAPLRPGDRVKFIVSRQAGSGSHAILLEAPNNAVIVNRNLTTTPHETEVTLTEGTYQFVCTNSACGDGHFSMFGSIEVGEGDGGDNGNRY